MLMPRLHLPRSSYDLFVYDFPFDFFGIVGGYKLRRICVYIAYDHLTIFSGGKLGQNLTETLRISYDNRKVIVQSSCYLHDLSIKIARCPYDDLAEVARSRYADCAIVVYFMCMDLNGHPCSFLDFI